MALEAAEIDPVRSISRKSCVLPGPRMTTEPNLKRSLGTTLGATGRQQCEADHADHVTRPGETIQFGIRIILAVAFTIGRTKKRKSFEICDTLGAQRL